MKTKTELLALVDRVTAERDAALEKVEALKHWRDLALQFDNHRMKALWHLKTLVSDGAHYDAAAAFLAEPPVPASELQQLLTAADDQLDDCGQFQTRQIAVIHGFSEHVELLKSLLKRCQPHLPGYALAVRNDVESALKYDEVEWPALKPADGGGDEA